MSPNRIRRRASPTPPPGIRACPGRHGHRTLPELAQVPRVWPARRSLDTRGGHPSSYFATRPSNGMAGSTMPICAYRHACHCSIISLTLRNRPWTGLSARIAAVLYGSPGFRDIRRRRSRTGGSARRGSCGSLVAVNGAQMGCAAGWLAGPGVDRGRGPRADRHRHARRALAGRAAGPSAGLVDPADR